MIGSLSEDMMKLLGLEMPKTDKEKKDLAEMLSGNQIFTGS